MTQDNPPSIRLYVAAPLLTGALVALDDARAHYVRHVMRKNEGDVIAAFNAESGEWEATLRMSGKRHVQLAIGKKISAPRPSPDVWFAFAAIKNKNELVTEKATELGASQLHPIITQHSVVRNINVEKLEAHAIEAAEQCERHDIPGITPHKNLANFLGVFPKERILLYGDESGKGKPLPDIISEYKNTKLALLIGPEGGFSADEHRILQSAEYAVGFGMGPRILRADTAAIAALACIQSATGDWSQAPHFKGAA
jgi:16S rRNA (uracil1498-N3)-methyltransferase